MKFIIFFTFAVGLSTTSGLNSNEVGYHLALGSLEDFFKIENEDVSNCYKDYSEVYENGAIEFSEKIKKMKNTLDEGLPTKRKDLDSWGLGHVDISVAKAFPYKYKGEYFIKYALDEMENIVSSLYRFFHDLKANIFNGKLAEGGNVIKSQKDKIKNLYKKYLKHGIDLQKVNKKYYNATFPFMDNCFEEVIGKSKELTNKLMDCFQEKNINLPR